MPAPGAAGHGERVEGAPVEAGIADDAVAASFQRRHQQARGLAQRLRPLAGAQHLREEGHRPEHRAAARGVDIFHHQGLVGVAVAVAVRVEHRAHRLPAIDVHGRGPAVAPVVRHEAGHQPAGAVDLGRMVGVEAGGLLARRDRAAALLLRVVVLEMQGVEDLHQRQVEHGEVDRRLVALVAVIVPGVVGRQHHVAGAEDDVLALHAGEVHRAREAEADGVGRVPVRRHHLVGVVEAVGGVHGGDRGARGREAGIDQDQRAALGIGHRDQRRRTPQQGLDLALVAPEVGQRAPAAHELPDLVVRDLGGGRPEGKHVAAVDIVVERGERRLLRARLCPRRLRLVHSRPPSLAAARPERADPKPPRLWGVSSLGNRTHMPYRAMPRNTRIARSIRRMSVSEREPIRRLRRSRRTVVILSTIARQSS